MPGLVILCNRRALDTEQPLPYTHQTLPFLLVFESVLDTQKRRREKRFAYFQPLRSPTD
jgi:hypothetical protein